MMASLSGSCLCGAIRFQVDAPVKELRACHCTHCQKASGTSGSVNAVLPASSFRITQGTPKRFDAKADSGRTLYRFFCGNCGSPLYSSRASSPEIVVVRAGAFDELPGVSITANIWTRSARSWAHIDPATKQFPMQPDSPPAR